MEVFYLFSLTISVFFFGLLNLFFRKHTEKSSYCYEIFHSRKHILKFIALNIIFILSILFHMVAIFFIILSRNLLQSFSLVAFASLFVIAICSSFYGSGMYIMSIVLKAYTKPSLRRLKLFRTNFMPSHFFHGILSHNLMYSGFLIALLALALLNIETVQFKVISSIELILILGILLGIMNAAAQILNGMVAYQFIVGIISMVVFIALFIKSGLSLFKFPIATYFVSFCLAFIFILAAYLAHRKILKTPSRCFSITPRH